MKLNNQIYAFLLITLSTALTSVLAQQPLRTLSTIDAELVCICGEASLPYAKRVRLIHRLPPTLRRSNWSVAALSLNPLWLDNRFPTWSSTG